MKPSRVAALVMLISVSVASLPAWADGGPPTTARQRYQAGAEAYSQGKYSDAVDLFLAADRIAPSAALSFDIARSYEKLGETSLALRWYRDYLHRAGDPADGPQVRRTVAALELALRDKGVQQVTIRSVPRGATVAIDDEPAGVTPWTGDLPPGRHRATLTSDGYERAMRVFSLASDDAMDLDVRMTKSATDAPAAAPVAAATPVPAATAPAAATLPTPEPTTSSGASPLRTIGIVTMSVGGASLGGALTFELLRQKTERDAKNDKTQVGYSSKLDSMEHQRTASRVLLGVGAGLAVTGGVLFFVGHPSRETGPGVALGCTPALCGASASGRF